MFLIQNVIVQQSLLGAALKAYPNVGLCLSPGLWQFSICLFWEGDETEN